MNKATYSELSRRFSPCDLLLFRGGDWISKTIMKIETIENGKGEFSHVGVIVNSEVLPNIPQLEKGKWYILESTCTVPYFTDGVPDIRTGMIRFGVQIRDLEKVVIDYEGIRQKMKAGAIGGDESRIVAWARLKRNPWRDPGLRELTIKRMTKLVEKVGYRPYEYRLINLLAAAFPWLRRERLWFDEFVSDGYHALSTLGIAKDKTPKEVEESTLFCSQLVCMVYKTIGRVDKSIDPADIDPMDYLVPRDPKFPLLVDEPIEIVPN
jgi:hypothetical protein